MKSFSLILLCLILALSLCACDKTENNNPTDASVVNETVAETYSEDLPENNPDKIIGTWVCDDISDDCYFIFDENGDAFAKWGTCTVYGYYDFYSDENVYDIEISGFLYNEYTITFDGDEMELKSDESEFDFEKATMPEITIKAPKSLNFDEKLVGDWQSEASYECYRFNDDNTAVITDLMNEATIDCKYDCKDGIVTLYYMSSETIEGNREYEYSFDNGKLTLGDYVYEKVAQ